MASLLLLLSFVVLILLICLVSLNSKVNELSVRTDRRLDYRYESSVNTNNRVDLVHKYLGVEEFKIKESVELRKISKK